MTIISSTIAAPSFSCLMEYAAEVAYLLEEKGGEVKRQ